MASWTLLFADPKARASPTRNGARKECDERTDQQGEKECADQSEETTRSGGNPAVSRVTTLGVRSLVCSLIGWGRREDTPRTPCAREFAYEANDSRGSDEHPSEERAECDQAHRKGAARPAAKDAERLSAVKGGEDERLTCTSSGERAVAQEPDDGPPIERADLL